MALTSIDKKNKDETIQISRQEYQKLEKLACLGEILGGMAHEINNPLQIILGKTQILTMRLAGEKTSPKMIEDLSSIERGAQRIAELISSLSELTQKSSEKKKFMTDVDLNYLIGLILPSIKACLKDKKIEFLLDLPEKLPKVKGNPSELKELFLYLTLNAKQRINWGGRLELSVKKDERYLQVELKDQGESLSETECRLSEVSHFSRAGSKSDFGILNINQILQEHNGFLDIKTDSEKKNILIFRLPTI